MVMMLLSCWIGGSFILCLALAAAAARRAPQYRCQYRAESSNFDLGLTNLSNRTVMAPAAH